MTLNQFLGDSITHSIPLRWQGEAFEPGEDWLLLFTAKADSADTDADALIQKASGYGIAADGSTASVAIVPEDTVDVTLNTLLWDIQAQHETTGEVHTVATGNLRLSRDVTRETTPSVPIFTTAPPVPMGPAGPDPVLTIGSVTTGAPGSPADATINGTSPSFTLDLTIPAGASVTAANIAAAMPSATDAEAATIRVAMGAPSAATGFLERFDDQSRWADGATITHMGTTPVVGIPWRLGSVSGTPPTVVRANGGLTPQNGNTLFYLGSSANSAGGKMTLAFEFTPVATDAFATGTADLGCNVSFLNNSQIIPDSGAINANGVVHTSFTSKGVTDCSFFNDISLTRLDGAAVGGVHYWNARQTGFATNRRQTLIFEVDGDYLRVTAVGHGSLLFHHPNLSTKLAADKTHFWWEPSGTVAPGALSYQRKLVLHRATDNPDLIQAPDWGGANAGNGPDLIGEGPHTFPGQGRFYRRNGTIQTASYELAGAAAIFGGSGTTAKGIYNRPINGFIVAEGPLVTNLGFTNVGAAIAGVTGFYVDQGVNSVLSSAAGAETSLMADMGLLWGAENGDGEEWEVLGQLVGAGAKRIRVDVAGIGDVIDSNVSGTPLDGVSGVYKVLIRRHVLSGASHTFFAELHANGVLIAIKRIAGNLTNTYAAMSFRTTSASAGGVTIEASTRLVKRVNY